MRSCLASLPWSLNLALRRCRNDYDRSLSAGKDSETTHALGLRSHSRRVLDVEIVRNRSRILLLVFARFVGVALREKSQNGPEPPTYGWGEATALDTRASLHQRSRRFSYRRDRRLG